MSDITLPFPGPGRGHTGWFEPKMTHPPHKPKSSSNKQESNTEDEVIQRLINEVRLLREQLEEIRFEVSKADVDFDRLSVVGGIKRLAKDRREFQGEVRKLNKELDKLIKLTK